MLQVLIRIFWLTSGHLHGSLRTCLNAAFGDGKSNSSENHLVVFFFRGQKKQLDMKHPIFCNSANAEKHNLGLQVQSCRKRDLNTVHQNFKNEFASSRPTYPHKNGYIHKYGYLVLKNSKYTKHERGFDSESAFGMCNLTWLQMPKKMLVT